LLDGTAADASPLERALITLARKTYEAPARLTTADVEPVRAHAGDGALDYVYVITAFHFINRIADLLHVDPEALPESLRRFELLRRLGVRLAGRLLARMDLENRPYGTGYEEACRAFAPLVERATGRPLGDALAPLAPRPKIIEALRLSLEERDTRSTLARPTLARIHRTVEAALPATVEQASGFHARPADPVEAFAFVGTRYAHRTTEEMARALRDAGYDDLGILDLTIAVADANTWARMYRLLGLPPDLLYLRES
jgi:alkylhydroperoxidase family enzyme